MFKDARWLDPILDVNTRVDEVLGDLSSEDMVAVALGDFDALVSRGIPAPHYVDAGTGLRDVEGATAFPAGIALAASFDKDLAEAYGAAVGMEARRAGFTVVLGPTLDLARDPVGGRVAEAFGEDPHLVGVIGAAHVRGLQSRHVVAQVKHYVAYNGEKRRTGHGLGPQRGDSVKVVVFESRLHDVYLRPFEAAVRAGAWSLMGSYNRINGEYVCESASLLDLPRRLWGWQGFYCPDFLFAVRDPAKALAAGLDLGALGGAGGRTRAMVESAGPDVARSLTFHVVHAMLGCGLVDDPPSAPDRASSQENRDLALDTAVAGSVLLHNDGVLPLAATTSSLAVIGPSGLDAIFVGGGAASVTLSADRLSTPLSGLRERASASGIELRAAQGSWGDVPLPVVPLEVLGLPDGTGPGVAVEFSSAKSEWTETRENIDHSMDPLAPGKAWPRRWRTVLTPRVTGRHRLSLTCGGMATLRIDECIVLEGAREVEQFLHGPHYPMQAVVDLRAGMSVAVDIEFEPGPAITIPPMGLGPTLRLGWQEPDSMLQDAVDVAKTADAAIVFVTMASGEGMDRDSLQLPGDQDELIRRVAAANTRTIVILNTPGAILMPWSNEVAAILQVWFPGERYGTALAAMLFGDQEPGGRLPITFPTSREHLPGSVPAGTHPVRLDYNNDGGIGYRSASVREHGALFPFGHGLTYAKTTCHITSSRTLGDGSLQLDYCVFATGSRHTSHVIQVYAQLHGTAERELVAFESVSVRANTRTEGSIQLTPDALARWDSLIEERVPVSGTHTIIVTENSSGPGTQIEWRI